MIAAAVGGARYGDPVTGFPTAEATIDDDVVRALLLDQHPDLAHQELRWESSGWDNVTYRLGDDLAVRLPRISAAADLIRKEQEWLPRLAPELPVAVPVPVRIGEPGSGYPWPWSVVPWFEGTSAEHEPVAVAEAGRFGRFLSVLHRPAPPDAPRTPYRGIPLTAVEGMPERIAALAAGSAQVAANSAALEQIWRTACATPRDVPEVLLHSDLHPKNLVVAGGRLAAVLDWGDLTIGDPATDLAAAWMLFPLGAHPQVWEQYGPVTPNTFTRATGWAVFFGVTLLEVGLAGDEPFADVGARTLARVTTP